MYEPPETLARGSGVHGELALRRRVDGDVPVYELIVNGVFLMDTAETSTERLLADAVLARHQALRDVLVGGLGLGFTVKALLADSRVESVEVVEIEPLLVEWLRAALVPSATAVLADPRMHVVVADIGSALAAAEPTAYDAILLDVDNGPDFLVHENNAAVYQEPVLATATAALRPDGMLAVWSAAPSEPLRAALAAIVGNCEELTVDLVRGGRQVTYHLYFATARSAR